jgi:hypothetical protein
MGTTEDECFHCSACRVDCAAHFQEVLEMSVGILGCLTIEGTCLDHVDKPSLQLKAFIALVGVQSSRDIVRPGTMGLCT